jgi:hypothetical protein
MKTALLFCGFFFAFLNGYTQTKKLMARNVIEFYVAEFAQNQPEFDKLSPNYVRIHAKDTSDAFELRLWRWFESNDLLCRKKIILKNGQKYDSLTFYYANSFSKTNPISLTRRSLFPDTEIQKILNGFENKIIKTGKAEKREDAGKLLVGNFRRFFKLSAEGHNIEVGFLLNPDTEKEEFLKIFALVPVKRFFVIEEKLAEENLAE